MRRLLPISFLALCTLAFVGCAGSGNTAEINDQFADLPITAVAGNTAELSMFVQAVEYAGLTDELRTADGITVFAPTNRAFERLPEDLRNELMSPEGRSELAEILRYHVAPARYTADDLIARGNQMNVGSVETLHGDRLSINAGQSALLIDDAAVMETNIMASNGIIHAVDAVLLPPTYDNTNR